LAIGISVAIWIMPPGKTMECWSNGVLGLKAEIDLNSILLPLVMRDPNMVNIFLLYQRVINPLLHHFNTPVIQVQTHTG
jgi:hypothetical protein